jgi:hypothetical protein
VFRRLILVAAALALVALVASPGRAAACLCGSTSADPPIQGDVAFIGVVAAKDTPLPFGTPGHYGIAYTFAVEEVLKGDPAPFTVVYSGYGGGDCGIPMAVGERWRIEAYRWEGNLSVGICSGTTLLDVGVIPPPVPGRLPSEGLAVAGVALGIGAVLLVGRWRSRRRSAV